YSCFVSEQTRLPFMTMWDAVGAILALMKAPKNSLRRAVYHVAAFSPSARDFREKIVSFFPNAEIDFAVDENRQSIVDSWPMDIDDTAAREQWGWNPEYDFDGAFEDYLIPEIRKRYNP
ncbi:MAG: epimerase, partial [Candidatus Neomarinimicrobiota bacterium]